LLSTAASDAAALWVGIVVGSLATFSRVLPWEAEPRIWFLITALNVGLLLGSWLSARTWGNAIPRPTYGRALAIWTTMLLVSLAGIVVSRAYFSRPFLGIAIGVGISLSFAHRFVRRRRPWSEPMILVSSTKELVDDLAVAAHATVIDVIDPSGNPPEYQPPEGVSIVLDLRTVLSEAMSSWASSVTMAGYNMRALTNVFEEHTGRLPMVHLAEGWELSIPARRAEQYALLKRILDITFSLLTIPLWVPLSLVTAVVIRLDSPGPALFRQERIGQGGERFSLLKFRTMSVDAEKNGPQFAKENDERFTRLGPILRKIRLDEIPQMVNVLKGDLSLVGPRPEQAAFVEQFSKSIPFYDQRHIIRPGITGWAQTLQGYAEDEDQTVEKLSYDLYYVKHMSLWLDIDIILRSVWTVLSGTGAR